MRRRRLLILVVGVLALLVLWGWLLLRPKPQPLGQATKANFDRVQEGMTPEEVAAILGPRNQYTKRPAGPFQALQKPRSPAVCQGWLTDDTYISIYYNSEPADDRRVVFKDYNKLRSESLRDRLRRWLPWCERALGSS